MSSWSPFGAPLRPTISEPRSRVESVQVARARESFDISSHINSDIDINILRIEGQGPLHACREEDPTGEEASLVLLG